MWTTLNPRARRFLLFNTANFATTLIFLRLYHIGEGGRRDLLSSSSSSLLDVTRARARRDWGDERVKVYQVNCLEQR